MDYEKSICFSPDPADQLNEKAFSIDKGLYLFAHYEPKHYLPAESFRSRFLTAVVNLYGLFWDCCPFMQKLLETPDSILLLDWTRIRKEFIRLRSGVGAFRSIFCHNNTTALPLNEENCEIAQAWIEIEGGIDLTIDDLEEEHWEKLLQVLAGKADSFTKDLSASLRNLAQTTDASRRAGAVRRWKESIAENYLRNPEYLLNAMVSMYLLYLMKLGRESEPGKSLRTQTINWLFASDVVDDKNKWWEKWLDKPVNAADQSRVYSILSDWPNQWAIRNGRSASDCNEAPMPGGVFLRILASDVDRFASDPHLGYSAEYQ